MCCFFKSRKTPAWIVFILSVLAVGAAAVMVWFSVELNKSEVIDKIGSLEEIQDAFDFEYVRELVFKALLILGGSVILTSICGILTSICDPHRCFVVLYGIWLLPIWILIVTFGSVAVIANSMGAGKLEEECEKVVNEFNSK